MLANTIKLWYITLNIMKTLRKTVGWAGEILVYTLGVDAHGAEIRIVEERSKPVFSGDYKRAISVL